MDKITQEKLSYNKALIANAYINRGRYVKAYDLICKIENEVKEGKSEDVRKTMVLVAELYRKLGYSGNFYTIYEDLKEGKWGECEEKLLDKIKPKKEFEKVTKFAPGPELTKEHIEIKKDKMDEKVVLAKFYLERRKSRMDVFKLLKEIVNAENEEDFITRKTMYQTSKLYGEIGLTTTQKSIESDLREGKWGKCEKQILDKINDKDKKDLWKKTKELFQNNKKVKVNSSILFSKC